MNNIKTRTIAIATMGMMTAACTSATAGNYAENDYVEPDTKEEQLTREENREKTRIIIVKSHEIAEEAMEAAHEALAEAHEAIREIEIDEDKIKIDVEKTIRLAMIEAEANLKDMEIEFKEFDSKKFKYDMENMHHGLEKAVKEKHLTKKDMDRIIAEVEGSREKAMQQVHEALQEIRQSLKELREEAKSRKEG